LVFTRTNRISYFWLFGFLGFFPKLAAQYISPKSAIIYQVFGSFVVALAIIVSLDFRLEIHPKGIFLLYLPVLLVLAALSFFIWPCKRGMSPQP